MARLSYTPILVGATYNNLRELDEDIYAANLDFGVSVPPAEFAFDLVSEGKVEAQVSGKFSVGLRRSVTEFKVRVFKDPSPPVVQRVNKLLKGSKAAFRFYHRSGDTRLSIPGSWLAIDYSGGIAVTGEKDDTEWKFRVAGGPVFNTLRHGWVPEDAPADPENAPAAAEEPEVDTESTPEPSAAPEASEEPSAPADEPVKGTPDNLFRFPKLSKATQVVIEQEMVEDLDLHWKLHTNGHRQVLAMVGPTGTGKTSLAFDLAARQGVGIMVFDAVGAREFGDWVGTTHLRDGKTEFVPSGFLTALDANGPFGGQPRIVCIDEVNRAESSGALNALMPVLHGFGSLYVPEIGRGIDIDPAAMVVMTANRGSQYAGTVGLDRALADRVTGWFKLDYLTNGTEVRVVKERSLCSQEQAEALCRAADKVRAADARGELPEGGGISTRAVIEAAIKVAGGAPLHRAAVRAWVGLYPEDGGSTSESSIVQTAIDSTLRGL